MGTGLRWRFFKSTKFKCFFWLQHYYGYQPFETEIYYKSIDYIDL